MRNIQSINILSYYTTIIIHRIKIYAIYAY